jgi:hypothetical protein
MNCCPECFGDRGLRRNIIPSRSTEIGRCSYCGSESVNVLPPSQLAENFELLISTYERDPEGRLLIQWFRDDWGMFEHPSMADDSRANDLLAEILDNVEIVRQTFSPVNDLEADRLSEWEKLRDELMYHNRFFPEAKIDLERLEDLLKDVLTLEVGEVPDLWYRARIQPGDAPFVLAEMGAPPKRIASHGRANPAGIPYLYLGSTQLTAISEIRPHTSEIVCVADFRTPNNLKLVDLRRPKKMVSPFDWDAANIRRLRSDLPFLERLGNELTRPVVPQAAAIDYTPSQYLCEFIKKCGLDGVVYRSSIGDEINLALFDPALAAPGAVSQYRVKSVSVEVERVEFGDPVLDGIGC